MGTVFTITSVYISDLSISFCFQKLRDSTNQSAVNIRREVEADRKLLETIASQIAQYDSDFEEDKDVLSFWKTGAMLDGMALLLPEGEVYVSDDTYLKSVKTLSFAEEASKGVHICQRTADSDNPDKFYMYHLVPVIKNGDTQALLCGIIDLDKLSARYVDTLGNEQTFLHMIESGSGAFLIDTVHTTLGNAQNYINRKAKTGYSVEDVLSDVIEGRDGETAFFSTTRQEYFYCAYEPVGVNDWMVMLVQPESVAFREANNVRVVLRRLAVLVSVAFLLYFVIVFRGTRKAAKDQEKELSRVQYMLRVEEILFNAARKPGSIESALQVIAERLNAQYVFLIMYDKDGDEKIHIVSQGKESVPHNYLKEDFPVIRSRLIASKGFISYDLEKLIGDTESEYEKLKRIGIESLMTIPVTEPDHTHVGSLGAANLGQRFDSLELLECVMLSFSMAVKNIESFQAAEELGIRDKLTGLKNQNSYQHALSQYENSQDAALTCIYVDADGLHEINNSYGHETGDRLLETVAKELFREFGEDTYRIGGDEFVVFCQSLSMDEAQQKIQEAKKRIQEEGYHISVGIARWADEPFIYGMIKQAETRMFEAKRKYHEDKGDVDGFRLMNRKLEETLMEKRNLDIFRAVLSSKYLGVYIVDLRQDTFRSIYIPSYFDEAALKSGGKFSEAVKIYIGEYARREYDEAFMELLDYENTQERLDNGEVPRLLYKRPDGMKILLRIYRSPDFGEDYRECIWTFEKAE